MYEQKQQYHIEQARGHLACSPEEEKTEGFVILVTDKENICAMH